MVSRQSAEEYTLSAALAPFRAANHAADCSNIDKFDSMSGFNVNSRFDKTGSDLVPAGLLGAAMAHEKIIADLESRNLIAQLAGGEELARHLAVGSRTVYCGFDPTAESLHIGNLLPLLALRRFQLAGHRPIALIGGATGMIGDPSFKDAERKLNSVEVIADWVERIKPQLARFLDFDCGANSALLVNNLEWIRDYDVLDFLRDIGKHFSVNSMILKESVRQRIEREDTGISFTEFSYMILQSFDFAELRKRYDCTIQVGGSDQWGNITGGIDLTRRLHRQQVYGVTFPLVTKADGAKFGKTEAGTVWLDPAKTSPYAFYQFWLNTADADAYDFLRYFTFLPPEKIERIERADAASQARPVAQGVLAREATKLVHGDEGLAAAERITAALFSGELSELEIGDILQLKLDGLTCSGFEPNTPLIDVLVNGGLAKSRRIARDLINSGAVSANNIVQTVSDEPLDPKLAMHGKYYVIRRGKKHFHLAQID